MPYWAFTLPLKTVVLGLFGLLLPRCHHNCDDILRAGWWRPCEYFQLCLRHGEVWDFEGFSPVACFGLSPQVFLPLVRLTTCKGMASIFRVMTTFGVAKTSPQTTGFLVTTLFLLLLFMTDLVSYGLDNCDCWAMRRGRCTIHTMIGAGVTFHARFKGVGIINENDLYMIWYNSRKGRLIIHPRLDSLCNTIHLLLYMILWY